MDKSPADVVAAIVAVNGCIVMTPGHRKTVRHANEAGHAHLLTFSCYRRMPLLTNDAWRTLLSAPIDRATQRHRYDLIAFVYMPEHVHLLVLPRQADYAVAKLLHGIKRPFSFRIGERLRAVRSPLLERLTVRERPGVTCFRFWQEGPGHDRNLVSVEALTGAADYIHLNPVRRGLIERPEQWRWSSSRHYLEPSRPPDPALPCIHGFPA